MTENIRKGTTKSGGQKHTLDKFYTKPDIAKQCLKMLPLGQYGIIIEPSAGNGSFSNQIPNVKAFDTSPEHPSIIKQDWLLYEQVRSEKRTLVVGNPPFGQQNSLAVQFFNHAAGFADTIAFILPLSFMKESLQNKLDNNFRLVNHLILPKNSFTLNDGLLDVPCVFQVWDYMPTKRPIVETPKSSHFRFVKKGENPDFYIQRIGGRTGSIGKDCESRSEQSNYFIKTINPAIVDELFEDFSKLVHPTKDYGVGPRSISKKEMLLELKNIKSRFVD